MPKISIIIPVYNVEKYLRQCLDSVVNQTFHDIEIICANDGSSDNSLSILKEYAQKDNRIKIIDPKERIGLGNIRNLSFKKVTSEYIMFVDSDDWLELNACESAYNKIVKDDTDFVMFGIFEHYENNNTTKLNLNKIRPFYNKFQENPFETKDIDFPFLNNAFCWYKIYKTNFLLSNDIKFGTTLYEDNLFNFGLFAFSKRISVLYKPLYYYRARNGSVTQKASTWKAMLEQKNNVLKLAEEYSSIHPWFVKSALVASINSTLVFFKRFIQLDKSIENDFYNEVHKIFADLNKNYDIKEIKDYIDYHEFKKTAKYQRKKKLLIDFMENIFSIYKVKKNLIICLLGKKIIFPSLK
ncbi:MAG: glycosyltransferase family 2 protein [Elusimicrobia bacterium]|nr:glycosyltransferase family 2 protein [Elusimicrobiota bacterium]